MNRAKHILKEKGVPQQEFVDSLDLSRSAIVKTLAGTSSQGTFESKLSYVAIICSSRRYTVLTDIIGITCLHSCKNIKLE